MLKYRPLPKWAVLTIMGTMLVGSSTVIAAEPDEALSPIVDTILRDRDKVCNDGHLLLTGDPATFPHYRGFVYDKKLEAVAQAYARPPETKPASPPVGYKSIEAFLGAGDPQAQAINRAYGNGARKAISNCAYRYYGVGFVRHEDRSVDVVTIVFGVRNP